MATAPEPSLDTRFCVAPLRLLRSDPEAEIRGTYAGTPYTARIAIPNYGRHIAHYYRDVAGNGLDAACKTAGIPFEFIHFGLILSFSRPTGIAIHDESMHLDEGVRSLVGEFGPVIFQNACIAGNMRVMFHRNIFPHLRFHVDRGPTMPNQFSCFTRDPFDAEQRHPRTASTLFIANIVAWLETMRTGATKAGQETGVRSNYDLFTGTEISPLFNKTILEQPWAAPEGTGEIAVIDNRTALHATYQKSPNANSYRIGARYLF